VGFLLSLFNNILAKAIFNHSLILTSEFTMGSDVVHSSSLQLLLFSQDYCQSKFLIVMSLKP
jgi:hypothetical protein